MRAKVRQGAQHARHWRRVVADARGDDGEPAREGQMLLRPRVTFWTQTLQPRESSLREARFALAPSDRARD